MPVLSSLGVPPEAIAPLQAYLDLLWSANEELNLVSRKMTFAELIDNHLIDCLLPLQHFPTGIAAAADFGTGGGLPGVVYAILFPKIHFHLFEKSPKKREFLNRCKRLAGNLTIHAEIPASLAGLEAGTASGTKSGIDLVVARAFKPIDVILDVSREYYSLGGKYFLFKGRREKIDEELQLARKKFKDLQFDVIPLASPVMDVERNLVLLSCPEK